MGPEKKGKKMRRNFCKLLKTYIEKMSTFRLSKMLMKTNELRAAFQDVDENKTSYTFMNKMSARHYYVHSGSLGAEADHRAGERRSTICSPDGQALFDRFAAPIKGAQVLPILIADGFNQH